ncbi:MAG: hypothetical protein JKX78_07200 [Alteromonadaceae bacterium]|nr:hypothetical protein [Alteromonadaceae bacterium]
MLTIEIDDPALEANIKQTYGEDTQSMKQAFLDFLQSQQVKQDVAIAQNELEQGKAITSSEVFNSLRAQYQ